MGCYFIGLTKDSRTTDLGSWNAKIFWKLGPNSIFITAGIRN